MPYCAPVGNLLWTAQSCLSILRPSPNVCLLYIIKFLSIAYDINPNLALWWDSRLLFFSHEPHEASVWQWHWQHSGQAVHSWSNKRSNKRSNKWSDHVCMQLDLQTDNGILFPASMPFADEHPPQLLLLVCQWCCQPCNNFELNSLSLLQLNCMP